MSFWSYLRDKKISKTNYFFKRQFSNLKDIMNNEKDNNEIEQYKESYLLNSVFVKDTDFQYIFKKTEKIVTAIYLITNFFSVEEPLKWSLRNSAGSLLGSTVSFSTSSMSDRASKVHKMNENILELSSFFDLAFRSGFVSVMNYEILNFEISKLTADISRYNSDSISSHKELFSQEYFEVKRSEDSVGSYKGHVNDTENKANSAVKDNYAGDFYKGHKGQSATKGHSANDLYNKDKSDNSKRQTIDSAPKKTKKLNPTTNKRRRAILEEVRKNGVVSVKEIAKVVTDCSEKTLQRELLAMVAQGQLIKKGERRWSRYSIK
jgi:hypothetical protein